MRREGSSKEENSPQKCHTGAELFGWHKMPPPNPKGAGIPPETWSHCHHLPRTAPCDSKICLLRGSMQASLSPLKLKALGLKFWLHSDVPGWYMWFVHPHAITSPLFLQLEKEDNKYWSLLGGDLGMEKRDLFNCYWQRRKRNPPHPSCATEQRWELCSKPRKEIASPSSTPGKPLINISTNFEAFQSWQIEVEQILFACNAAIPGKMDPREDGLREVGGPVELFNIFWLGVTLEKCPPPWRGTGLGCWRGLRDIPPWNTNYIPKMRPPMRSALASPGKCEVVQIPSSLKDLIPLSLHPGISQPPWDLFLNPATPSRFLKWGEVLPSAVFSRKKKASIRWENYPSKWIRSLAGRISSPPAGKWGISGIHC